MADRAFRLTPALCLLSCVTLAAAQDVGTVQNPKLDELSGLARSRADAGILWAHNDSGNAAVLYRLGLRGEDLGTVDLPGGAMFDWEDIAAFEWRGRPALLLADVGDNFELRSHATLYAVSDPGRGPAAELLWRMDFRYPDGPQDCEAMAVDPRNGDILLLTKSRHPPRLYRLPMPPAPPKGVQLAEFLGAVVTLPPPTTEDRRRAPIVAANYDLPTALDISDDGSRAVIVTLKDAHLYRRKPAEAWVDAFARTPQTIALPRLEQIEAGALSADGRTLFVASEKRPAGLARVALP